MCLSPYLKRQVHWREFLLSLQKRGVHHVKLITSDAHEGLKQALKSIYNGVPWQRCQCHLQRNAQAYVPKKEMKQKVASDIRDIFDETVTSYEKKAPKLSEWMESNLRDGFTVFDLPKAHRIRCRTTNPLERVNREKKRRTVVATLFPNEASCLRLVSAVLMEISEDWETDEQTDMKVND